MEGCGLELRRLGGGDWKGAALTSWGLEGADCKGAALKCEDSRWRFEGPALDPNHISHSFIMETHSRVVVLMCLIMS